MSERQAGPVPFGLARNEREDAPEARLLVEVPQGREGCSGCARGEPPAQLALQRTVRRARAELQARARRSGAPLARRRSRHRRSARPRRRPTGLPRLGARAAIEHLLAHAFEPRAGEVALARSLDRWRLAAAQRATGASFAPAPSLPRSIGVFKLPLAMALRFIVPRRLAKEARGCRRCDRARRGEEDARSGLGQKGKGAPGPGGP
jgi:hypothetical protein